MPCVETQYCYSCGDMILPGAGISVVLRRTRGVDTFIAASFVEASLIGGTLN